MCCSWENRNTCVVLTYVWQHVNRKESGPTAGPHRSCLQRESPAVTLRKVPAKPQDRKETQLPLLGTEREDAAAALAASQHPGSKGAGQGPEKSKLCLPAQAQGQTDSQRWKTGTSRSVGTGSSPGFQGTTAQHGAEQAGSQSRNGLSPGSQGAATTALCPSEQTQAQPQGWAQQGCRELGHSTAHLSKAHTTHNTTQVCFTLSTLQGDRPCTRHPNLWLHPT